MQPPAGKLKKSCGKITNFYDKKEPSGPEVNPKSQTKIRNRAIFKMKAHIRRSGTNRNYPADFSPPLHGATSYLSITRTAARPLFYCVFAAENVCIWPPSKALFGAIRHILAKFQDSENKESHDKTAFANGLSWLFSYRSGETRTRGLLLPKQARYQLRNTPEKYYHSILFFAAFVNPEVRNFTLPLFVRIFIRKSGCKGRKGWSIMGLRKRLGAVRLPK